MNNITWNVSEIARNGYMMTLIQSPAINFGVQDSKGREVGAIATIRRYPQVENGLDSNGQFYAKIVGPYAYHVTVQVTRDGAPFGAAQYPTTTATLDDAEAIARSKVEAAAKRMRASAEKGKGRQWNKG